jgi:predicted Zn-dependent protease
MRRVWILIAGLLALSAGSGAAALTPDEQRARINLEVAQLEEKIAHSGDLYVDPALDAYLQEITNLLYPELTDKLRVRSFSDSDFNAFATPLGGIYFHTGALLRIRNEAQLAAVLGHEGVHYTAEHTFQQVVQGKKAIAAMSVTLFINPLFAAMMAVSSMSGFSRENEREADRLGLERAVRAGYNANGGLELFSLVDRELAVRKLPQGMYFYASHPRVKERVESFREMAAPYGDAGERNAERYLAITERARVHAVAQIHKRGDGKLLLFLLAHENLIAELPPETRFYLAEGYRLRGEPGDDALAAAEYERTVRDAPSHSSSYQALGMQHMRAGRKQEALARFEQYIALDPNGAQSRYVQQYVASLKKDLQL